MAGWARGPLGDLWGTSGGYLAEDSPAGPNLTQRGGTKFCQGAGWDRIRRSTGVLNSVQGLFCDEDSPGGQNLKQRGGTKFCQGAGWDKI